MADVVTGKEQVLEAIAEILTEFNVDRADVGADASFDDLGFDSLDLVEVSLKIETAFGIEIEEEDLVGVVTVGDAARLVLAKRGVPA